MTIRFQHVLVLCIAVSAVSSYASIAKQSYPATEETPSVEVISSAPGYRGQATGAVMEPSAIATEAPAAQARQESLPAPSQPQSEVVTIAPAPPVPAAAAATDRIQATYDSVPASQVEPLIRRLRIVEALVAKYGRAYNYRDLTVTQLGAILGQLDAQANEAAELRRRIESRSEIQKEVREQENASDNSLGSEAPEEPIPPPSE